MTTPETLAARRSGPSLMKLVSHIPEAHRWRRQADALIVIGRQFELAAQERGVEAHVALGTLRFSLFHLHQGRIAQLAPLCRSVTVYGEADVEPPTIPNVTFVPLPSGSPLSQEWFLVVDSPVFWGAMVTQAIAERANGAMRRYQFEGVLTAEERVVSRASLLLSLTRGQALPEITHRDPVANAARWARIAYALAIHSEARRLKLVECLSNLPALQSLLAEVPLAYDQVVPLAIDALRRFYGTVGEMLYRYLDGVLVPVAWSTNRTSPPPHSPTEGLVGQAFQQGQLVMQSLVPTDPEYALLGEAASAVAIPISPRGERWGVLLIGEAEPDPHEAEGLAPAVGLATLLEELIGNSALVTNQPTVDPSMSARPSGAAPVTAQPSASLPASGFQTRPSAPAATAGAAGQGASTTSPFGPGSPLPSATPPAGPAPAAAPFGPAPAAAPFGPAGPLPPATPPSSAAPAAAPFGPAPAAAPFGPAGSVPLSGSPFGPGGSATFEAGMGGPGGSVEPVAAGFSAESPGAVSSAAFGGGSAFAAAPSGRDLSPAPAAPQFGLPPWLRSSVGEPSAHSASDNPAGAAAPSGVAAPPPTAPSGSQGFPLFQRRLMGALVSFDQHTAEGIWREAAALYPAEALCTELLMPVQVAIGEAWHRGEVSVAAEHFASRFVESKLHNLFSAHADPPNAPLAVIGCAQGELHELGALTVALFLKWAGFRVKYLGQSVPNSTLETVVRTLRPQILGLSATTIEAAHSLTEAGQILSRIEPPRPMFVFGGMAFYERLDLRMRVQGGHFLEGHPRSIARHLAAQFLKE